MTVISNQIWLDLEAVIPSGENLVARPVIIDTSPRLLCALDAEKRRHILIVLRQNEPGIEDTRSRGVSVITRDLHVQGQPSALYIDIICHNAEGYPAFDLIGN